MRKLLHDIRACRVCTAHLAFPPKPVFQLSPRARLLISGQAPGTLAHRSGLPFDDPSGDRLREWLGIDRRVFYDKNLIAILPMGMCYPGRDEQGADLPPRPECAPLWHERILAAMPEIELHLLVGGYSQKRYLGERARASVRATVRAWREYLPAHVPLPHPSWRNNAWLKKNRWFDRDVLPYVRRRVRLLIEAETEAR
jgi:uracil-DNA glycosylase